MDLRDEFGGLVGDNLWVGDSAASDHISPSTGHMLNYQQYGNHFVRIACGGKLPVVDHRDLDMVFRSGGGVINITLHNVNHVSRPKPPSNFFEVNGRPRS